MLNKQDALRIERDKNNKKLYIYNCSVCGKEIRVWQGALKKHQGRCKICSSKESIKKIQGQGKLPHGESSKNYVIRTYQRSAKYRKLEWNISSETLEVLFSQPCYYCGRSPSNVQRSRTGGGDFIYNGIDRIDNNKGYTESNCVSCCKRCNVAKANMTKEEFLDWSSDFAQKIFNNYDIEIYHLYRKEDATGVSGTGVKAIIFKLTSTRYMMEWLGQYRTLTYFNSLEDIKAIHGHDNKTIIIKGLPKECLRKKQVKETFKEKKDGND